MYTKGEWKIEDETNIFCGDKLIATAGGYSDNYTSPRAENKANAHLIASAPDLYEACNQANWLLGFLSNNEWNTEIIQTREQLRKAIAKAGG